MTKPSTSTSRTPRLRRRGLAGRVGVISSICGCILLAANAPSAVDASVTHRFASSVSQSRPSSALAAPEPSGDRRLEDANDAAAAVYDDDEVNAAMAEREDASGDDGYLNMELVDFDEVSIMPVSCVN